MPEIRWLLGAFCGEPGSDKGNRHKGAGHGDDGVGCPLPFIPQCQLCSELGTPLGLGNTAVGDKHPWLHASHVLEILGSRKI